MEPVPLAETTYFDSYSDQHSASPRSSSSSVDEDEFNHRLTPYWPKFRHLIESRGFYLDTFRHVKDFYHRQQRCSERSSTEFGYHKGRDDDALCRDPGLPDNLFRGTRISDGVHVVVKAVHQFSRELQVIRYLSSTPMREDPMNHCIPVLDLIDVPGDTLAFIVMEEWSSQLVIDTPCCLYLFLLGVRQCIENTVFMHRHHIAHLDISLRNVLTDDKGHYACIDFELSRHYEKEPHPRVVGIRGTEIPPELERGDSSDPYKVDVWALAVLILRACKMTGYDVPELMQVLNPMLHESPDQRPSAEDVLKAFDSVIPTISQHRLLACSK